MTNYKKETDMGNKHANDESLSTKVEKMTGFDTSKIKDVAERAEKKLHHLYQNMDTRAHEIKDAVEDKVTHYPFRALAVSALSGLVLGMLLRRK